MATKRSYKQEDFAREFLIDLNATQAAIRAGYSPRSAEVTGHRLLRNPKVAALIQKEREKAQKRNEISLDRIIQEYATIAFSGMSRFIRINAQGEPVVDLSNCTPEDLDLLAETTIEDFTDGRGEDARDVRRVKIKTMDRLKALETLGRHLGLGNKTQDDSINNLADAFRQAGVVPESMPIATARKQ